MRDDAPEDLVHELFGGAIFPEHAIGREVIGSPATIELLGPKEIGAVPCRALPPEQRRRRGRRQPRPRRGRTTRRARAHPRTVAPGRHATRGPATPAPRTGRRPRARHRAGACRASGCAPCAPTIPIATRSRCSTRRSVAGCRPGSSRRSVSGVVWRTRSTRTAPSFEETGSLAVAAGTAPERLDELLGVIDAELARLVDATRDQRARARRGQGSSPGLARAVARELERSHAPARPQRADAR